MNDISFNENGRAHQARTVKLEVVSATRYSESDFWEKSALGNSLACFAHDPCIVTRICFENRRGLPDIYNESIQAPHDHDILLFVHDDVWLHDYFLVDRLIESLADFDVVGLAGNRRRSPEQIAWFSTGRNLRPDVQFLSGVVGHGKGPFEGANFFGPTPAACELLDGAFLAAKKSTLRDHNLWFDPRFDFHFYDMDFCRSARLSNGSVCLNSFSRKISGAIAWWMCSGKHSNRKLISLWSFFFADGGFSAATLA